MTGPAAAPVSAPAFTTRPGFQLINKMINPTTAIVWRQGMGEQVNDVTISPDGRLIFAAIGSTIYCFDMGGGLLWRFPVSGYVYSIDISLDGGTLVFGTSDRVIYSLRTDSSLNWKIKTGGAVLGVAINNDGGLIIAAGDNRTVYAFDRLGEIIWRVQTKAVAYGIGMSANAEYILVGSDDNTVTCYDKLGKPRWSFMTGSFVRNVDASQRGETLVATSRDRNLYSLGMTGMLTWKYGTGEYVLGVGTSRDGKMVLAGIGTHLTAFDQEGRIIWRENMMDPVVSVQPSLYGAQAAVGVGDGIFYIGAPQRDAVKSFKTKIMSGMLAYDAPEAQPQFLTGMQPQQSALQYQQQSYSQQSYGPQQGYGQQQGYGPQYGRTGPQGGGGFCRYCGSQIQAGSRFCARCGKPTQ